MKINKYYNSMTHYCFLDDGVYVNNKKVKIIKSTFNDYATIKSLNHFDYAKIFNRVYIYITDVDIYKLKASSIKFYNIETQIEINSKYNFDVRLRLIKFKNCKNIIFDIDWFLSIKMNKCVFFIKSVKNCSLAFKNMRVNLSAIRSTKTPNSSAANATSLLFKQSLVEIQKNTNKLATNTCSSAANANKLATNIIYREIICTKNVYLYSTKLVYIKSLHISDPSVKMKIKNIYGDQVFIRDRNFIDLANLRKFKSIFVNNIHRVFISKPLNLNKVSINFVFMFNPENGYNYDKIHKRKIKYINDINNKYMSILNKIL